MDPAARWLAERLGVDISDPGLLARALTHRSHGATHNESAHGAAGDSHKVPGEAKKGAHSWPRLLQT